MTIPLVGIGLASNAISSLLGDASQSSKTKKANSSGVDFAKLLEEQAQKASALTSNSPAAASVMGKQVTVKDANGQSVTGQVEWVDASATGYTMKVNGKTYTDKQLQAVNGVSITGK